MVLFLAGLVVVPVTIALGCGLLKRGGKQPSVTTEAAARRDIAVTIEATGVVEPVDLVEVKSKASGQILRMPVEVGSVVRVGDLLAQIDTVDVQNQYEQAYAAERAAQAKVDVSAAQLKRAEELYAQQVITVAEHESATLDYANAESQLVKARTDFDTARQRRADATVRAPVAGTVLEQLVSAGQVIVSATSSVSGGTALLRMADLGRIRLRALVSETDIGSVKPGQIATVSMEAFPQRSFQGEVEKVEPQAVVQQSVTMFPVLISITNEDGLLLPGMNGEVSMQVDYRDNVLAVPLDAVRTARELPSVAAALGMNADSVQAQLTRRVGGRRIRPAGTPGPADSTRRRGSEGWGGGVPGAGSGSRHNGGPPGTGAGGSGDPAIAGVGGSGDPPRAGVGGNAIPDARSGRAAVSGSDPAGDTAAGTESTSSARASRAQAVLVKTAKGIEPRLVRLGLSDFDYAQILGGLDEGDQVVLLGVVEQETKRSDEQTRIRERMGGGTPGALPGAGSGTRPSGGAH
jgi:HlyD family secretion protein